MFYSFAGEASGHEELKVSMKNGKPDVTLKGNAKVTTNNIINKAEFEAGMGGSMFGQLNPTMKGYVPDR